MLEESLENYPEAVYPLNQEDGRVRSIDVTHYLNYSKPSVCRAVKELQDSGCLSMGEGCLLHLTEKGGRTAIQLYKRRCFSISQLIKFGVSPKIARQGACRLRHIINDESFTTIKQPWGPSWPLITIDPFNSIPANRQLDGHYEEVFIMPSISQTYQTRQ